MKYNLLFLLACFVLNFSDLFSQADYVFYDESKGFIGGSVYGRLIDTKGRVWFGTEEGISMFENDKLTTWKKGESGLKSNSGAFFFREYPDGMFIAAPYIIKIGNVFNLNEDGFYFFPYGYYTYKDGQWTYHENQFKDAIGYADQCFRHFDRYIWLVSKDYGVSVYPSELKPEPFKTRELIKGVTEQAPKPPYNCFSYDGHYLWIGTEDALYCFDFHEDKWKDYSDRKDLKNVKRIINVNDIDLFVSDKNVFIFRAGAFELCNPKLKLENMVDYEQYIDPIDSSIWLASDKGMLHFKDGNIERFLENQDFTQIIPYGNGFITASIGGLFVYDGKEFKHYKNQVLADPVWLRKIGDEVWMLNRKYIYYTDKGEVKEIWPDVMKDAKTQLNDKLDTIMTKPNGDILFTMRTVRESNSIYVCHKDMSWTEYEIPNKNKFIALSVKSLLTDDFDLYMATSIGLFVLTDAGLQSLLPWDNGIRGNQMEHFFTSKWIVCSNEGVIHFPKGLCR